MNVYEMEGFLRGKCLPGDMKVNESNAQYLVRIFSEMQSQNAELAVQLANSESKCRELAGVVAENSALKKAAEFATAPDMWIEQADGMLDYRYCEWYVDVLKAAMETPATDAFLAEVRAQGVDMFSEKFGGGTLLSDMVKETAKEFAARLRKGAAL